MTALVSAALLAPAWTPGLEAELTSDERHILSPMIRRSSNRAASTVVVRLGAAQIDRIVHRVGMRRFHLDREIWGRSLITAREESRFFLHIDRRLPPRHRAWGMELLRTVVPKQRWGIGEVVPAGWTAYFKGGWGSGIGLVDHQVALLSRGPVRVSVAVLTVTNGTHKVGKATLRGFFARLLRGLAESA